MTSRYWFANAGPIAVLAGFTSPGSESRRAAPLQNLFHILDLLTGGKLTQYVPQDGVYVYFRHNDAQKVMVILNNNDAPRTLETKRFHEVIGAAQTATDVLSGERQSLAKGVVVPAHSAAILELH